MCPNHNHGHGHSHELAHEDEVTEAGVRRSLGQRAILRMLGFYQRVLSPMKPTSTCRFEPVCSSYAIDAVSKYGALRGTFKALIRLSKCGPWHPGGWDPVR